MTCKAIQHSDQMNCVCGNTWDVNDPNPPACKHATEEAYLVSKETLQQVFEALDFAYALTSLTSGKREIYGPPLNALRTILASPPKEPVAWATRLCDYAHIEWGSKRPDYPIRYDVSLYTKDA